MATKKILLAVAAMVLALALVGCAVAEAAEASSHEASSVVSSSLPEPEPEPEPEEPPAIAVRYLEGEAVWLREGEEKSLTLDTLLVQGDEVKTRGDGMVVLKLDGDKQVQIAPDSHVAIKGFERAAGADRTLLVLHAGNIINILDAPLEDAAGYEVETPSLVMAIRGTIVSVSSDAEQDRVMLFEGVAAVKGTAAEGEAEVPVGGYARTQNGALEQGDFTGKDLNPNEYWFLYEAEHAVMFDEPGAKIAQRLAPLLDGQGYQDEAISTGRVGGPPTGHGGAAQTGGGDAAPGVKDSAGGGAKAPAVQNPPVTEQPPAADPPAAEDPPPGNGGGMDEATFRAIEQEFLQAKEDYNSGLISKDAFLAIKQKYIDAKKLYYGD